MQRHNNPQAADAAALAAPHAVDLTPEKDKARGANAGQVGECKNEHRDSAANLRSTERITATDEDQRKAKARAKLNAIRMGLIPRALATDDAIRQAFGHQPKVKAAP